MGRIEFDFQLAETQIRRLEELKTQAQNLAGEEYEETMCLVNAAWEGEIGHKFLRRMEAQQESLVKLAKLLDSTETALRGAYQEAYEAENAATEIAEERKA